MRNRFNTLIFFTLAITLSPVGQAWAKKDSAQAASVFVSPRAKQTQMSKVAVLPFKAPVELAGASIADVFTTEILKTYKYRLIERSQMEQVLDEKALGMQGVISSSEAIQIGKLLGVEGVILGTVPEYGLRAAGENQVPSVGINIRMINVKDGSIVWSASDSAVGNAADPISSFAVRLVQRMVNQLVKEWVRAGYTFAINLPSIQPYSVRGQLRKNTVAFARSSTNTFIKYRIYRSRTRDGIYQLHGTVDNNSGKKGVAFTDKDLLDSETYYYKVSGVAPSGLNGPLSEVFEATTAGPPEAVNGFTAEPNKARHVPLRWTPNTGAYVRGYNIYRSNSENGPFEKIKFLKDKDDNAYIDKGGKSRPSLKDFTDYYYQISAVNTVGVESRRSSVTPARTKPVPEPVKGYRADPGLVKQVALHWELNAEQDIKSYRIYSGKTQSKVTRKLKDVSAATTDYMHTRLKDGTTYYYRIQAIDEDGLVSEISDVFFATTKPRPAKPTGFTVDLVGEEISISWNANAESDIRHYELKTSGRYALDKRANPTIIAGTEISIGNLKPGGSGKFQLLAVDETGLKSDYTDGVKLKIPKAEPVE